MSITPFAVAIIVIFIYLLFNSKGLKNIFKNYLIVLAVVTLNVRMGYFVGFGNSIMAYRAIITYVVAIVAIIVIVKNKKTNRKLFYIITAFICALIVNAAIAKIFPYSGQVNTSNWVDYVYGERSYGYLDGSELQTGLYLVFICNCIILLGAKSLFSKNDVYYVISKTIDFSKISIALGFVEWIITNIFHSTIVTDICIRLFGSQGAQFNFLTHRGLFYTIQGITKEPSMFATAIFYISILIITESFHNQTNKRKRKKWLICCFVLLAINMTLSSYLYLLIDTFLIFITGKYQANRSYNIKIVKRALIVAIAIVAIFSVGFTYANALNASSNYIIQRIGNFFIQFKNILSGSNLLFSSEAIRMSGIVYDFSLWLKRPLFGFGLGSLSCISGIVTFLVNGGIVCVMLYIAVIVRFSQTNKRNLPSIIIFTISVFVLPNVLMNEYETIMCIAIPLICYEYSLALCENINYDVRNHNEKKELNYLRG